MAPSSRVDRKALAAAVALIKGMGFNVYVHPQTYVRRGQSAGTAEQKARALYDLYANPKISAIFAAAGGNQAMGFRLNLVDYELIQKNPKILMGFSDVTYVLNAVSEQTGMVTFHGPTVQTLGGRKFSKAQIKQCFNLLGGRTADMPLKKAKVIHPGAAHGPLVGGNLSLIASMMGTPWQPDFRGKILFLEDCGDELSRIDRMLNHLRNAGVFDQVSGIVLGGFTALTDKGSHPYGRTVEKMMREALTGYDIPVIMNAPFGHGPDLYTLPVGAPAHLDARKGASRLTLDGPAVKL
jgi:muramoyltetrapeptide carboxypeptidase